MQVLDVGRIAQILTMTGPGVGAVVAYSGVAVLLLTVSPMLAAVVVVGVPLLVLTIGPLLRGLHGRQGEYREREGAPTTLAADIVTGLRVLCGIDLTVLPGERPAVVGPSGAGKTTLGRLMAVVEDGRIIERGTHEELVAAGGPCAALWSSWHGTDDG